VTSPWAAGRRYDTLRQWQTEPFSVELRKRGSIKNGTPNVVQCESGPHTRIRYRASARQTVLPEPRKRRRDVRAVRSLTKQYCSWTTVT